MRFDRFEEIVAWQKARKLIVEIYRLFGNLKDWSFRDQIIRAAISVANNIAEGFERRTNQEFKHFLFISKGSCGEVRSMLYSALDLKYVSLSEQQKLQTNCEEISKIISGLIKFL
jgi:four helix bundle protein